MKEPSATEIERAETVGGQQVSQNVWLCPDGKYRWTYQFDMRRNPTILFSVWRVLLLAFAVVMGFLLILQLTDSTLKGFREYWDFFKWFFLILAGLLVLAVIAYMILAASFGWKYMILFTMDEDGIENRYMKSQVDKASAWGWLTALAGIAAGSPTVVGAGILGATRTVAGSVFAHVRKVKSVCGRHVIYVNQLFGHNQIYAEDADFEFVKSFIAQHCPKARIRG